MAGENSVDTSKFALLEGTDPATWDSHRNGDEYKKFLKRARSTGKYNSLTDKQKKDLKNLDDYEKDNGKTSEDGDLQYNESAIDWERLKTPYDVAFYLSYPPFLMSKVNKNIQNYVLSEYKKKSILEIVLDANKKLGNNAKGVSNKEKDKKSKNKETKEVNEEKTEEKSEKSEKPTLWVRFANFCRESNERDSQRWKNSRSNGVESTREEKMSRETQQAIVDKAKGLLEVEGIELGDE